MPTPTLGRLAAATTVLALIAGCSGGGGSSGPDTTSRTAESLAFGQTYEADGRAVTPIEIRQGAPEDLAGVELEPDETDDIPWFVRYRVENTGTEPIPNAVAATVSVSLFDGDDQPLQDIFVLGVVEACREDTIPEPFEPGAVVEACRIFLAPDGVTPAVMEGYLGPGVAWEIGGEHLGAGTGSDTPTTPP